MIQMEKDDPFSPLSFGSRPSMGAYWPDTRFIELRTDSCYFERLIGRRPRNRDKTVLSLAASVLHHERVHWQIAHSLSWGLQRSALISMKTTLASIFFRLLAPDELRSVLADRAKGVAPIARAANQDLHIPEEWSSTQHTIAEHAWLCGILTYLVDREAAPLARLRPPEFMLGVVSQYLASGFNPYDVVFADDREFGERAATFKVWATNNEVWSANKLPVQSVEECLALVGQLKYIDSGTAKARQTKSVVEKFRYDIVTGIFGETGHTYSKCFDAAQVAFRQEFDELDTSLLGLICELALDPPLPFDGEGCATAGGWQSFHPALRFSRLLDAAARIDWIGQAKLDNRDAGELNDITWHLLMEAGLERATRPALEGWLRSYDEDNTEWPSQELALEHAQTSIEGRQLLEAYPGLLFDPNRCAGHKEASPFFDLPYVVIGERTHVAERDNEPAYREAGRQIFNAHVARATDNFAFGRGTLNIVGLPTAGGFSAFPGRLHEFFSSAWTVEVPPLELGHHGNA